MPNDKNDNDSLEKNMEAMVRGILIGASLGMFASWIDLLSMDAGRAVALGGIMGALAGLTHKRMQDRKRK